MANTCLLRLRLRGAWYDMLLSGADLKDGAPLGSNDAERIDDVAVFDSNDTRCLKDGAALGSNGAKR